MEYNGTALYFTPAGTQRGVVPGIRGRAAGGAVWMGQTMKLDAKIPAGPLPQKWENHKHSIKLISPGNKRRYEIIVVGTGLLQKKLR